MTNLDSILKSRNMTLPTKVHIVLLKILQARLQPDVSGLGSLERSTAS